MDKKAMLKQAAQVLREQQVQIEELQEKLARDKKAETIVKGLIESDALLAHEVLSKLSELRSKSLSDLDVMEKAAELYGSNYRPISLGRLSEQNDGYSYDPLTAFLINEE